MKPVEEMTYQEIVTALIEVRDEILHDKLEDELFERLDILKETDAKVLVLEVK